MTIIAIIENLILMLPALLIVAYVTVAERKTMASMQRRLGPNAVGQNDKFSCLNIQARSYHTTRNDKALEALYKNRKVPLKPFEGKTISDCDDLLSSTTLNAFFKDLPGKSGIYMFTLKSNPSIFYIGRAKDFQKRLKSHLNVNLTDRFHTFAKTVG